MKLSIALLCVFAVVRGCQVPEEEGSAMPPAEPAQSPSPSLAAEPVKPAPPAPEVQTPEATSTPETPAAKPALGLLQTKGRDIVDPQGQIVRLRGCNIGNWLLIEPWMFNIEGQPGCGSEKEIWDIVNGRFGKEAKLDLINAHRRNFFTEKDVARIADMGLNCLRLPLWWRAVADPDYAGDMAWVDRCVEWCSKHGVYVIIDMHGTPGGPSRKAVITGEPNDNELWTDITVQEQTLALWKRIASHYKDEPAVAGYDLLNEATDAPFDELVEFYGKLYAEIRSVDTNHILFIQDGLQGFHRLPLARDMGWQNVAYSFHYYPQDSAESLQSASTIIPRFNRAAIYYDVPIYVGEFNTLLSDRGGSELFLRLCEVFDYYGWAWTFWSYKKVELSRDVNWGVYGLVDPKVLPDFNKQSFNDLLTSLRSFETSQMKPDALLEAALREPLRWSGAPAVETGTLALTLRDALLLPGPKGGLRTEWGLAVPNAGYWAYGDTVTWTFTIETEGVYELVLDMASGVDDCPAQLWLDGVHVANVPQAGTGAWEKYDERSAGLLHLASGRHTLDLSMAERGQSMNLRGAKLRPATGEALAPDGNAIWLRASNMDPLREKSPIRIEWLTDPPHIGFWTSGEKVTWHVRVAADTSYKSQATYGTPTKGTKFSLSIDGNPVAAKDLPDTGDWSKFETADLGIIRIPQGEHVIEAEWTTPASFGAGNMREIRMQRVAGP